MLSVICKGCINYMFLLFMFCVLVCFLYLCLFVVFMDFRCPVGRPCCVVVCVYIDCAAWVVLLKVILGGGRGLGVYCYLVSSSCNISNMGLCMYVCVCVVHVLVVFTDSIDMIFL
jgi:hypothetical protein